jgi:hypothetical protein
MHPPRPPSPTPDSAPAAARRPRVPSGAWGALLFLGGALVWASVPDPVDRGSLPEVWRGTGEPRAAADALQAGLRPGRTRGRGDLLRLSWPAHPLAREYRLTFRLPGGGGPEPVTVRGNIFLYDLDSNALRLPAEFTWEVAAVLPDGSEVRSPARSYPPR